MKTRKSPLLSRTLAFFSIISLLLINVSLVAAQPPPPGLENEQQRRQEYQQRFLDEHKDRFGRVRPDLWRMGIEATKRMKIAAGIPRTAGRAQPQTVSPAGAGGLVGVQWTQRGPAPLRIDAEQNFQGAGPDSGEVVDIAIDPRNATDQTIYIATNDGGVWKSTDGGVSWSPRTDYMESLSMGALALDPGNPSIVYAGTGNPFDGGSTFSKGVGIYKSIDAGETWSVVGGNLLKNRQINRIVMPAPNVLLVATDIGVYRSIDGGLNFGANSPSFNDNNRVLAGFATDIDLDTATPATVYASINGSGIFRSTDAGSTFPANGNLFTGTNGGPTTGLGFIAFSQSTQSGGVANNQTMYALVATPTTCTKDSAGNIVAGAICAQLFGSTNTGTSWNLMSDAQNRAFENNGCQCGYDQTVGVDPQDPTRVYIGFQELYLSTDGGANFGTPAISQNKIHWDHHALMFSPSTHWGGSGAPTRFYVGTDGGIAGSADGASTFSNLNEGIATNLFFGIDIGRGSAANSGFTYGGTQDTGTIEHRPEFAGNDWHLGIDGDGGPVAVDPNNPLRVYATDNSAYRVTDDGGTTWSSPSGTGLPARGLFRFAVDPNNSAVVYATAGRQLFQSTDTGATFTSIRTFPSSITAIANVQIDSNTVWVGLNDGTVQWTANALAGTSSTWTAITVPGAPSRSVTGVAIDPSNTAEVVAVYPGLSNAPPGNRTQHVFRTADFGATWNDISGTDGGDPTQNLPDLPLHSVVIDPGTSPHTIIVSSDAAVMRTANLGATWQVLGVGLPTVDSKSLAIDTRVSPPLLRIGTYGRSVFELTSATGPLLAVNANLAFGTVAIGSSASRIVQLFNVGSSDLHINNFTRVAGSSDFQIVSGPATPVTVPPGEEIDFTVRFQPTSIGDLTATFQINSDDPFQPARQLVASGTGAGPKIVVASTFLQFDAVPVDDRTTPHTSDQVLQITNQASCAQCDLKLTSLLISGPNAADFFLVAPPSLPVTVAAGSHLDLTVRFNPSNGGVRSATLTVSSDDPAAPSIPVALRGTGLLPAITASPNPLIFGPTVFDPVCNGLCGQTLQETITDSGQAELILDQLLFSGSPAFSGPGATNPLTRVLPTQSFLEPVTFRPTGEPARKVTGTLHIEDTMGPAPTAPAVPQDVPLCGESVGRGIRVLAYDTSGNLISNVSRLSLQSHGTTIPINIQVKNLSVTTINPPTSCQQIQFHYENQDLPAANNTAKGGSYYTLTVTVGSRHATLSFTLAVNEFKIIVVTVQ